MYMQNTTKPLPLLFGTGDQGNLGAHGKVMKTAVSIFQGFPLHERIYGLIDQPVCRADFSRPLQQNIAQ